ncbi:hypothetical protein, partial [Bacillus mycoides]|uniref:hypothetical protein n=1 Tax=Bacillus mycoides TaxID=1405 RepID=UPI0019D5BA19
SQHSSQKAKEKCKDKNKTFKRKISHPYRQLIFSLSEIIMLFSRKKAIDERQQRTPLGVRGGTTLHISNCESPQV